MSHLVITIGCEYGAKGNQIGRKIAEDLGFQFYDRNIVDAIIHEVGIPGEIMEKVEEGVTIVGKGAEGEERGEFSQYADLTKRAIHVQKTIIRKLSDRESCVIIGRSADYILKEHKPILRVFIYSPDEVRIKNVMESHKVSEKEAKQIFEDNLDYTIEKFPEHVMTDEMAGEYRELFADLAKKTSYTVGEATREENGTYQVVLTVKPITLLKDTYAEFQEKAQEYATKVSNDVMNGQAMPEETQMQTEIYQIYYEVLSQAAEKGLKYGKPNKIVLHVEKDKEGKYGIRKADMQNLDHLLIESVEEE